MAILIGIDEAGFGPTLGPLVVSGVAFRIPNVDLQRCLWSILAATCTKSSRDAGHRLTIADSKQVYRSGAGVSGLVGVERSVLVMLAAAGQRPKSWMELLDFLAPDIRKSLEEYPWYAAGDSPLPLAGETGDVGTRATALRRDCLSHDVEFLGACVEALPEGHFNRLVRKTRNKHAIAAGLVLRIIDRLISRSDGSPMRVCADRLGGRVYYREDIRSAFPGYELAVLEESDVRSAYRLTGGRSTIDVEFVVEGEDRHFPIALASLFSKYLRESFMHRFNAYWCEHDPSLRPTAGYYSDARRWLTDAAPLLRRLSVDRTLLVRER